MSENRTRRRSWRRWFFLIALLIVGGWYLFRGGAVPISEGSYLFVDIGGTYQERAVDDVIARLAGDTDRSLVDLLLLLRAAAEDDRIVGLVTRVRGLDLGWAKAQEIRAALQTFRDNGKTLVAYLENEFGSSTLEYFVASAAESVYVPPAGGVVVNGLLAEYMFLGGVWEKLDIDMQVIKIGEYKSAGDMYANKEMSAPHREMADALLDSIYGQFVSAVANSRRLDEEVVRALVDRGPMSVGELQRGGLIDGTRFFDEIEKGLVGIDGSLVSIEEFEQGRQPPAEDPAGRVAVLFGVGTIITGEGSESLFSDETTMGSDTMAAALDEASEDDEVDAIVLRVDSPGGSALASDLIWRATQTARATKPVIVSMSDVAGSGGYYVAAGANRILAGPGTLTGSIGVVLAKPNVRGLLTKLGVNTTTLRRGARAGIISMTESFDESERRQIQASMEEVYRLFVERVSLGRSMDASEVDAVGRGRVWTGEQARERGLVDQLGGILDAIDEAKVAAGIDRDDKVEVVFYPRARGLIERLASALSVRATVYLPRWLRQVRSAVAAYDFPDGSILTAMPQKIEIR